jgi:hypothetical protein
MFSNVRSEMDVDVAELEAARELWEAQTPPLPMSQMQAARQRWNSQMLNPGQHSYPPLVTDQQPQKPFIPSHGFGGRTGGTLDGASSYGNSSPPTITAESLAATITYEWGGSFHPFD